MNTISVRKYSRWRRAGFSLVETLMATSIISTTALGTLALLASAMSMGMDGQARSKAMIIAQDLFHDLQSGSPMVTPSVLDERQTKGAWPLAAATYVMPRHVILFDSAARPLPVAEQPASSDMAAVYDGGAPTLDASWLAMIEGVEQTSYTVDPATGAAPGAGTTVGDAQIPVGVDISLCTALGGVGYDYPAALTAPAASAPAPKTALTQITISIEAPPEAPAASRKKYRYSFFWNR